MKIAVLGSKGQLGRDLIPVLPGEVVPLTRDDLDLDRPETIAACLNILRPDVVINTAAYNFVDKAESEPDAAFRTNAWGVRTLARVCEELKTYLVHFSTDFVFGLDVERNTPLSERDLPGPVSAYGLSKLTGEYLVRANCSRHLVIRTCGLYGVWGSGGKGGNFVETMLKVAGQGKPLRVVNDQRCSPTFCQHLAVATAELIKSSVTGLFHVTNSGDCTWFEFAAEIFRQSGVKADLTPITSAQFGAPARRPTYSVLSNDLLRSSGISPMPDWHEALSEFLKLRETRTPRTS